MDQTEEAGDAVVARPQWGVAPGASAIADVGALLKLALDKGVGVETLERLVALHERVTDRQAVVEFNSAFAAFQESCPRIDKNSTAEVATRSGGRFSYRYAELDHVADVIGPHLRACGLSYNWDSKLDGKLLEVTCHLRHVAGHGTRASFSLPFDASSPSMNSQQAHAAALTYGRRQSLIAVLGLTTCDPDTDAASTETITDEQIREIEELLAESRGNREKFFALLKVGTTHEIKASDYAMAIKTLRDRIDRNKKAGS